MNGPHTVGGYLRTLGGVARLAYNDQVLKRVQHRPGTWVRGLCEGSHPYYAAFADTLARWFFELGGNARMVRDLTSPDDVEFFAGRWELTAARLFSNLGFEIEFEPPVQSTVAGSRPKTPDFRARGHGLRPLVEVFNLNPSAAEANEDEQYRWLSGDLASRLRLSETGMLSLRLYPGAPLNPYPDAASIDEAASAIQAWWDAGHGIPLRLFNQRLPIDGFWMDSSDSVEVIVLPPARVLTPDRVRNRLEAKLGSYKNLAGEQLVLFVGTDYWTHSASTLVTAMFGESRVGLIEDEHGNLAARQAMFSGKGLMTEDEVTGHPGAKLVAGCMFARHATFNEEAGSWDVYPQFIHNPWTDQPLPNGLFSPIPEYQLVDGGMRWTTEDSVAIAMT